MSSPYISVDKWTPPQRDLIMSGNNSLSENTMCFNVISYNILHDAFIDKGDLKMYGYVPDFFKESKYRNDYIIKELLELSSSIIGLQEVNLQLYAEQLLPALRNTGYEGVISCTNHLQPALNVALLVKTDAFELESSDSYMLNDLTMEEIKKSCHLTEAELKLCAEMTFSKYSVLFVSLRCKQTSRRLCVGVIHMPWTLLTNNQIKCVQLAALVHHIVRMAGPDPFILMGDFNMTPDCPGYELLTTGRLDHTTVEKMVAESSQPSHQALSRYLDSASGMLQEAGISESTINTLRGTYDSVIHHISSQAEQSQSTVMQGDLLLLVQELISNTQPTISSYAHVLGKEPSITSAAGDFSGCLDYIFYRPGTSTGLLPLQVLDTPSIAMTTEHISLPSPVYPSDHLPVMAGFVMQFEEGTS